MIRLKSMERNNYLSSPYKKKIWIDLDNTPHVPFFKPIIEELNKRGYATILTTRDCFQVCGLADLFNLHYKRIGHHYGKNKILKVVGMFIRALQLAPIVMSEKPDVALSHGSRAQLLLASMLGIPSLLINDYEHSKYLPIIKPDWLILPEVIPSSALKKHGRAILNYPGIKEDVYVPDFEPDDSINHELGFNGKDLIVTIRPPANEAHYHNPQSDEFFKALIDYVRHFPNVRMVLLPRNERQETSIRKTWCQLCSDGKILIPDHVVDGLNLIWYSDLVISGGGTMNREAAALGVPVYSIFHGKIGAVDRHLVDTGRLTLLESVEDIHTKIDLSRRDRSNVKNRDKTDTRDKIIDNIISIIENRS